AGRPAVGARPRAPPPRPDRDPAIPQREEALPAAVLQPVGVAPVGRELRDRPPGPAPPAPLPPVRKARGLLSRYLLGGPGRHPEPVLAALLPPAREAPAAEPPPGELRGPVFPAPCALSPRRDPGLVVVEHRRDGVEALLLGQRPAPEAAVPPRGAGRSDHSAASAARAARIASRPFVSAA